MGKPGRDRAPSPVNPPGRRCVLEGPPLGPGGEDITWPDQVAPRGRKASSTRKVKPQTSNLPGMHFFPASALVFVSVFLLGCFLGPGSLVLFFLSCWVL